MKKIILVFLMVLFGLIVLPNILLADYSSWWYSQRNTEWADSTLGDSNYSGYSPLLTIGDYGCALSCIAMLYAGETNSEAITPGELDVWCESNDGYSYLQYPQGSTYYPGLYPAVA